MLNLTAFNTIGAEERAAVDRVLSGRVLSGYLGGVPSGGYFVTKLEAEWREAFNVRHAIACNSATSGLLAALAILDPDGRFVCVSPYTMSATAAVAKYARARISFQDIDNKYFCMDPDGDFPKHPAAVIATSLFGHPIDPRLRLHPRLFGSTIIEDNAHAPFAMNGDKYTGTIGHIGVFSLNVHKHIQCGEGGVIVTHDDWIAESMRGFINHGELNNKIPVGLNLRMTEINAAIASAQLKKAPAIIADRIEQAEFLNDCLRRVPWVSPPAVRRGAKHVYYCWAPTAVTEYAETFVNSLTSQGFPIRRGYVKPLYELPAFDCYRHPCPVTEMIEKQIAVFENCAYNVLPQQEEVREIFRKTGAAMSAYTRFRDGVFS
jgi:perosamine synthetase